MANTVPVILEYSGGRRTDELYRKLAEANPNYRIRVLDNASTSNFSSYITDRNSSNSGIGGGIVDCLNLAEAAGAEYLFFVANDPEFVNLPDIAYFERLADSNEKIVLIGSAITPDSAQARGYPWMVQQAGGTNRVVPHCDFLCCLIRISFVRQFGAFPVSKGGWGYDWEFASYARYRNRSILIADSALLRHTSEADDNDEKMREMQEVYTQLYGDHRVLYAWRASGEDPELTWLFGPRPSPARSQKRKLTSGQAGKALRSIS